VIEKDQVIRGRTYTVRYDYSAGGRLDRITYPSGKVVDYTRDASGNIERIVAGGAILLDQVRYEPFGPVSGWVWGNGETHQRTYDLDGRLTSMTVPLEAPQLHVFGYDGQYRLNSASLDEVQLDWTYDATGNRLSETRDGATSSYQYPLDSHRLQGVTGADTRQFGYNAAGAINSDNAAQLTYDHRNRLVAGYGASYVINGIGQRVEKAGAGANTPSGARVFVYDEGGQLLGEYDAVSGVALAEHVYLDYWPVGLIRAHETFQVTPDHIGAPRAVVRSGDRVVVWNWQREPFGTGGTEVEIGFEYGLRFPGQYFDAESGLHYNYFRDYDPSIGRYIESDPIGLGGGATTYAYVGSSPLSFVDTTGLIRWEGNFAVGRLSVSRKITIGRRSAKLKLPEYSNFSMTVVSECVDGRRMRVSVLGEGTMKIGNSWLPSPATGTWASVELEDGLSTISETSLIGAIRLKGSGFFSSEGTITSGQGRGTFSGRGLTGGDFEFSGSGEPGDWSGFWERCSCDE
jgi:RHS repeat-associated protein